MIRVTPGWMVSVCPPGTVRLAVAMYGLQVLLHVPETFPDTKQAPWVKRGKVASAAQSAGTSMDERRSLGLSLRQYYGTIVGRTFAITGVAILLPALVLYDAVRHPNLVEVVVLVGIQLLTAVAASYFLVFKKSERDVIMSNLFGPRPRLPEEPVSVSANA